jgi:hypothetical protein
MCPERSAGADLLEIAAMGLGGARHLRQPKGVGAR